MPGIAGYFSFSAPVDQAVLQRMLGRIMHEPHYVAGSLVQSGLQAGVVWTSHNGSSSDCLPAWNDGRDICLILTGEIFGSEAEIAGSHLVRTYEILGPQFIKSLNGTFSGIVMDLRERKVHLFNDRFGLGRLYYHEAQDGLYFASEAKAIMAVSPALRRFDMTGLGQMLSLGCVLQNRTLFEGISLMPPASLWTCEPGRPVWRQHYFAPEEWEGQSKLSSNDYYEKLKDTFTRILPRYFRDREQMVMSLTGGLDSRIIMAWMGNGREKLPCYTSRGVFRECADVKIARKVAEACGQRHDVVAVDGDFLSSFPALSKQSVYLTDGCMDVSGAAGLYVNRMVRTRHAPIRMTGNYGSEILRRLVAFKPNSLDDSFLTPELRVQRKHAKEQYNAEKSCDPLTFIAFKQVPWFHYSRFALEQSQLTIRSPYLDNDLVSVAYQAPPGLGVNQFLAKRLIADGNPSLVGFPTDRGPLGRHGVTGNLRQQWQELTFKAEYAYDYGMPRWLTLLDDRLSFLHLEKVFLGRHKYYHYRYWYRHQLAPYVAETLLDGRTLSRSYLEREKVKQLVEEHTNGRNNHTTALHLLLTTELIEREIIGRRD